MSFEGRNDQDDKSRLMHIEPEQDDMNIKSNLNDSLDFNGINVSEDLVRRTLEAVKQEEATRLNPNQQADDPDKKEYNKAAIPWSRYIRRMAGAAAVIVVTAGIYLFGQVAPQSNKSSMQIGTTSDKSSPDKGTESYSQGSTSVNDSSGNASTGQAGNDTGASSAPKQKKTQSFTAKDTAKKGAGQAQDSLSSKAAAKSDNDAQVTNSPDHSASLRMALAPNNPTADQISPAASDEEDTSGNAEIEDSFALDNSQQDTKNTLTGSNAAYVTFRDIFLLEPAQVKYVKITNAKNQKEITLTSQADILDFYTLMDQYHFTAESDAPAARNYTIEVYSLQPEQVTYTMIVGNTVSVNRITEEIASQSIYRAVDEEQLITNLGAFFLNYGN